MELLKSRFNIKIIFSLVAAMLASFLISLALLQLFIALLFILWLFEKDKMKANDVFLYLILAFGLLRVVTIFTSEYFDSSLRTIQKELLFYTTTIALFFYLKTFSRKSISKLSDVFIHSGAVVAAIGFILFSMGTYHRAQSFGSGYATFSTYLTVILMFVLSLHSRYKGTKKSLLWSLETGLILTGIILAMGRADLVVAIVFGLVIVFLRRISVKKIFPAILIVIILTFIGLQFNNEEATKRISNPTTYSDRDILYQGFFELAGDHPFLGFGPRTFHDIFPFKEKLADKGVGSWHNEYVQTYIESGIFALIIFLTIIFLIYHWSKWVIFKPRRLMKLNDEKFALIFGITALLISGLTGAFLYSPILSILFAYFVSLFSYFCYIQDDFKTEFDKDNLT